MASKGGQSFLTPAFKKSLNQAITDGTRASNATKHAKIQDKQLARVVMDQMRKSPVAFSLNSAKLPVTKNLYLQAILNPEGAKPVGIPDCFSAKTACFVSIFNAQVEFNGNNDFHVVVSPSPYRHVMQIATSTSTRLDLGMWVTAYEQSTRVTLHNQLAGSNDHTEDIPVFTASGGNRNCAFHTGVDSETGKSFARQATGSGSRTGLPIVAGNLVRALTSAHEIAAANCQVQIYTDPGNVLTTGVAGTANVTVTAPAGALFLTKVEILNPAADISRTSLSVVLEDGTAAIPVGKHATTWSSAPELATMLTDFDAYRVVGMSTLMTYQGPPLQSGTISSRLMPPHDDPHSTRLLAHEYSELSSMPDSYVGPANKGTHVLWRPTDLNDLSFRPLSDDAPFTLPHVCITGAVTDASARQFNLRVAALYEVVTTKQLYSRIPSRVAPDEIEQAFILLSGFICATENPSHLKQIINWVKRSYKDISGITKPLIDVLPPQFRPIASAVDNILSS